MLSWRYGIFSAYSSLSGHQNFQDIILHIHDVITALLAWINLRLDVLESWDSRSPTCKSLRIILCHLWQKGRVWILYLEIFKWGGVAIGIVGFLCMLSWEREYILILFWTNTIVINYFINNFTNCNKFLLDPLVTLPFT